MALHNKLTKRPRRHKGSACAFAHRALRSWVLGGQSESSRTRGLVMAVSPLIATIGPPPPMILVLAAIALLAIVRAISAINRGRILDSLGWLVLLALCSLIVPLTMTGIPRAIPRNEAGAIGDIRQVQSAEVSYSSSNEGVFGTVSCLGAPTACGFPSGTPAFIDAQLAALAPKQGYARRLFPVLRLPAGD